MEVDSSTSTSISLDPLATTTTTNDQDMTIDYETDTLATNGVTDEKMGEDQEGGGEGVMTREVEEAEMADDEQSTWEREPEPEMVDDTVLTSAAQPEASSWPSISPIPALLPGESTSLDTDPSIAEPTSIGGSLVNTLLAMPDKDPSPTKEVTPVEPEETPLPVEVPLSEGEQADAEQSDFPSPSKINTSSHPHDDPSSLDRTDSTNSSTPFLRPEIDKASLLAIEAPLPQQDESTLSDETNSNRRLAPTVLLSYDNLTYSLFRSLPQPTSKTRTDSAQIEDHGSGETVDGNNEDEEDPSTPMSILSTEQDQDLYFESLEQLFSKLHDHFPELASREDELVLDFDEIGIALAEDNIYSQKVSLHDFDRIHIGCQLSGRLHVRLYAQSRFSNGFNALVQHVSSSIAGAGDGVGKEEEEGNLREEEDDNDEQEERSVSHPNALEEQEERTDDQEPNKNQSGFEEPNEGEEGDSITLASNDGGDEAVEGGEYVEESFGTGEEEHRNEGGEGGEEEGPDSEMPIMDESVEVYEAEDGDEEGGEGEGDEFDLEEALAQLDGDDVAAYVEGATEDFILSENQTVDEETREAEGEREGEKEETKVEVVETESTQRQQPELTDEVSTQALDSAEAVDVAAEPAEVVETTVVTEQSDQPIEPIEPIEIASTESNVAGGSEDVVDAATNAEDDVAPPTSTVDVVQHQEGEVSTLENNDVPNDPVDSATTAIESSDSVPEAAAADRVVEESVITAAEPVEEAVEVEKASTAVVGGATESTTSTAIDPNDVVIDYDEAFDGSSSSAAAPVDASTAAPADKAVDQSTEAETEVIAPPHSPKRRHDSLDTDEASEVKELVADGSDAKRPRLEGTTTST